MKKNYTFLLLITFFFSSYSFSQLIISELADPNDNAAARFVEIYNEQVYDLSQSTGKVLKLNEDPEKGVVVVAGVNAIPVNNANDVIALLLSGNKNRKTEATMANSVSSRSHAIFIT